IKIDQLLCWAATNIYPEGEGVKRDLEAYHITLKPLKILANGNVNGIDLTHFSSDRFSEEQIASLKTNLRITKDDVVFVFVGRIVIDKGINELVEAFSILKVPSSKPLLVGLLESDLDPLKEETLKTIEVNPNIISLGFQKDVRPYF